MNLLTLVRRQPATAFGSLCGGTKLRFLSPLLSHCCFSRSQPLRPSPPYVFKELASENAQLADEKSTLSSNLQEALAVSDANLSRVRDQERKAIENLSTATFEQRRAEQNLAVALEALDAVYLEAIGEQKLFRRTDQGADAAPAERLGDSNCCNGGLAFYERFARENDSPDASLPVARAYFRVAVIQVAS